MSTCCHICREELGPFKQCGDYMLGVCPACDHIQMDPIPDESSLLAMYQHGSDDDFYGNSCASSLMEQGQYDSGFLADYYSERLGVLGENTSASSAEVLDFGCTNGVFVKAAVDSGYTAISGYDVAEELVVEGQQAGLDLHTGALDQFVAERDSRYDLIMSYHVFEHLAAPLETFSQLAKMLKPGGRIYINVPHIRSLQGMIMGNRSAIVDPPYHVHYFTRRSLARLVEDTGLRVVALETPFWERTTDTYLELQGYSHRTAVLLRHLVAPFRWIIKAMSLGGTLAIVAEKPVNA